MDLIAGRLLVATPLLGDPNFERTVILMLDHGPHGSAGVILNRPGNDEVADLIPALAGIVPAGSLLGHGGPVEPRGVLGVTIDDDGELTPADLDDLVEGRPLRLFQGYSGWSASQLEAELAEHAWWVVDGNAEDVFRGTEELWHDVVGRQRDRRRWFRHLPDDPRVN